MTPIREHMSPHPHTIGAEQTVAFAATVMRRFGIRHLPVLHGGALVGMISDRDVRLVESLRGADADAVLVSEAMAPEPYVVSPSDDVSAVVRAMADRKLGSAIVADGHVVSGVFTTVDALHMLASRL